MATILGLKTRKWRSPVALAITTILQGAAYAQTPQTTSALEEVVVTAERRTQSLQDVPLAATVLTSDALDAMGIDNVNEIQQVAPSVAINTYNRSTFINIRGVGIAQSAPTSSPGVAFYIDGVLIPHEQTIGTSFYDIGAIEVLRGPQGTLTGQNSTGGAVYVRTPDPKFEDFAFSLDQTLGDYSWSRTVAAVNVPLGEKVAVRVAGVYDDRDSFTENFRVPGGRQSSTLSEPGNVHFQGYRASIAIQPTEDLRFNLRYEDYLNNTDHSAVKNRADAITAEPFVIEEDALSQFLQDGYRASGEIQYDLSAVRLRWLTSVQDGFTQDVSDGDRTATAPPWPNPTTRTGAGRVSYANTDIDTTIHELNVISLGDGALSWVGGAFYLEETIDVDLFRYNLSTVVADTPPTSRIITTADNTSKSVFGQVGYKWTPQWETIVGARYSEDKQVYNRIVSAGGVGYGNSPAESSRVTGRVALNWSPLDDVMAYVSASKGYKAGGVNLGAADPNFAPETNVVGELGLKTTVADGRLRINSAVFYSDYTDIQFSSLRAGLPVTENAASGNAYGAELEMLGQFGGLSINAGVAYLKAEFAEDVLLNNTNTVPNVSQLVPEGRTLPFSPELTASAGIQYAFESPIGKITPRVQFSYIDEQYATPFPTAEFPRSTNFTFVPAHNIIDARLTFDPTSAWRVELFATNITDEVYIASQIQNSTSADGGIIYGPPQQYGGRIVYKFE